jgi:hypothetical protein
MLVNNLVQKQKREYSNVELFFGNLAIFIWILFGTVSCWLFSPFAAIGFLALASFLVSYELGKKGCVSCFYCKTCTIGMGKLPELFFTKTTVDNLNINRKALKLFPYVYFLLSVAPLTLTVFSIIQNLAVYDLALFAALAGFSFLTGIIRKEILFRS